MFTVRIEIQGLFRLYSDPPTSSHPERIIAVAPWVEPEVPAKDQREATCPHDFAVQWTPRQLGHDVPGDAVTLWRLEGKRISFDFQGGTPRELKVNLDELDIPWIHPLEGGKGIFDHGTEAAKIKADAWKEPGEFHRKKDSTSNEEGVMGQILIDRGRLVTDDVEAIMTEFDNGQYSGRFTNRLALIVRHVDAFKLVVEDLVEGGSKGCPKGELPLQPVGDNLVLRVKHICPQFLIRDRPPIPSEDGTFSDPDFKFLYELCQDPGALKQRPIPVRKDDPHSSPRWECGSAKG